MYSFASLIAFWTINVVLLLKVPAVITAGIPRFLITIDFSDQFSFPALDGESKNRGFTMLWSRFPLPTSADHICGSRDTAGYYSVQETRGMIFLSYIALYCSSNKVLEISELCNG